MDTLGICSDHAGFELKELIKAYLTSLQLQFVDFGTHSTASCDYADFAHPLALAVENKKHRFGIAICGSGNGINITLNKHQGIRAALCWKAEIAQLARLHNDANVLVMPGRFIDLEEAKRCVDLFLNTNFEGGRHQDRINKIPLLPI